jgi:tetratricopeptide (TPR) repeat protein
MSALTDLVEHRILRADNDALDFVNEIVRIQAYCSVPGPLRRQLHQSIADHLLERRKTDDAPNDLEIAWHLTRAGRSDQAASYVITGARAALERGALYEAQQALTTSMARLSGTLLDQALLILAEALQEEGRWAESLPILERVASADGEDIDATLAATLTMYARLNMQLIPSWEFATCLQSLADNLRRSTSGPGQTWAIRAAAQMIEVLRDQRLASEFLAAIVAVPAAPLAPLDRVRWSCNLAVLHYFAGKREACVALLTSEYDRIRSINLVNSQAAALVHNLGAATCAQGDYERAATYFEQGYSLHERLGNIAYAATSAACAALSHGRQGNRALQLDWAERSLSLSRDMTPRYQRLLAYYSKADANAALGYECEAERALLEMLQVADALIPWCTQAGHLYAAEVYRKLGRDRSAMWHGRYATSTVNHELQSLSFAGLYAKWIALVATQSSLQSDYERVAQLAARVSELDAPDQVLVACAIEALTERLGTRSTNLP